MVIYISLELNFGGKLPTDQHKCRAQRSKQLPKNKATTASNINSRLIWRSLPSLLPFQSPGAYSVEPANSASNPSTMQSSLLMSMRNASFSVVDTNIHGNVIQVFSKHFLLRSPSIPMPSNPRAASVIPLASALISCSVKTQGDDQLYLTLIKDRDGGHWLYFMLIEDRGGSTFRFTPFLPERSNDHRLQ